MYCARKYYWKNMETTIYVEHLSPDALTPTRATPESVGWDLYSPYDATIPAGATELIKLDIRLYLPPGVFGKICERSGMALFNSIIVKGGVIDRDYTGNVGVIMYNHGLEAYNISRGDRVAQLLLLRHLWPMNVETLRFIPDSCSVQTSCRGDSGFGSSGR